MTIKAITVEKKAATGCVRKKQKILLSIPDNLHTVSSATPDTTSLATHEIIKYIIAPIMNSNSTGNVKIIFIIVPNITSTIIANGHY